MKNSALLTVNTDQWPVVVVTFHREFSRDAAQEAKDLKEWLEHFNDLISESVKRGSKFVGIYDHTHHQYPSSVFRIKTMQFIKDNFALMGKTYSEFVMIMPSTITRMGLKAGLAIAKFPVPVKVVSNLGEAMAEANKVVAVAS